MFKLETKKEYLKKNVRKKTCFLVKCKSVYKNVAVWRILCRLQKNMKKLVKGGIFQNKSEYNGNGQILDKSKTLKNSYETRLIIYIKNWIKLKLLLSSSSKRKDDLQ